MIKGHLSRDFSFPLLVSQYLQGLIILQAEVSCFSPPPYLSAPLWCATHTRWMRCRVARRGHREPTALCLPPVRCLALTDRHRHVFQTTVIIIIAVTVAAEVIPCSVCILAVRSNDCSDKRSKCQPVPNAKPNEVTLSSGRVKSMGSHEAQHLKSL